MKSWYYPIENKILLSLLGLMETLIILTVDFPGGSVVKNPPAKQ